MIIWSDGESEIQHPNKCKCGFCKIENSIEYCVKRWAGFFRPRHTVTGQIMKRSENQEGVIDT